MTADELNMCLENTIPLLALTHDTIYLIICRNVLAQGQLRAISTIKAINHPKSTFLVYLYYRAVKRAWAPACYLLPTEVVPTDSILHLEISNDYYIQGYLPEPAYSSNSTKAYHGKQQPSSPQRLPVILHLSLSAPITRNGLTSSQ